MAWRHAVVSVGIAARLDVKVQGGAGAMVAALRRSTWNTPALDAMRTRDGEILYFGDGAGTVGTHTHD